jgi:tRNA(Ile)-lysidine synthase
MTDLLVAFQESLKRLGVTKKDRILLAVSGGMDSIVLTACAEAAGLDYGIAHANFQLRGEESNRDEEFVRQLALNNSRPFFVKEMDAAQYAVDQKISIQTAARKLRYDWFNSLTGKDQSKFQFLLTAHHLDDQIETMLMYFFRGTGIAGMTGMPEKNGYIIRPFLFFPKSSLQQYAEIQKLQWVEDSSNASDDYTRNYFRHQLIPSVATIFPEVLQNLEKNLQRFSEAEQLYRQAVEMHKKKLLKQNGMEYQVPVLLLKKTDPQRTIVYEIIRDFNFTSGQTEEIIRLLDSENGKYVSSSSHRIIKNRSWLIITPVKDNNVSHLIIESDEKLIPFPDGKLHMRKRPMQKPEAISKNPENAWLDAGKIHFPLLLRKWKAGDYFYPLGMKKKKKLSRFFIDMKLSKTAKEKTWVLVMDKQILWVVGQRIDDRFGIGPSTSEILQFDFEAP